MHQGADDYSTPRSLSLARRGSAVAEVRPDRGARRTAFRPRQRLPGRLLPQAVSGLAADFDIGYLPAIGHDPRFPVSDGWPLLVDELIASIVGAGRARCSAWVIRWAAI